MSAAAASTQILFIDALVQDIDTLLSTIDPSIEVVLLNDQQDGLTQIANALAGRSDIDAVHVISHGSSGSLQLGSGEVTEATLAGQAEQLAQIRAALSDSADLMLYGCNVADGTNGASFIQALANATGADVAASTDLTGSALLGGDWELEASTGALEAPALEVTSYDALLGADGSIPGSLTGSGPWSWGGFNFQTKFDGEITDSDPENPMRAGNKWDRYALSGVTAGTTVYVYMGNSSTVDDFLQIDRNGTIVTQDDDRGDGERSYDAFVSWTYQVGDVIRATTYSSGYRGTYSLWIGTSAGTAPTATDIGSAPAPAPAPPTAPTFTDGITSLTAYADTGITDTFASRTGTLTASDTTPTGTLTYSGGGVGTYGTLGVASNGSFSFTPNAAVINALAAGASVSDVFSVTVSDGGLSTSKNITVNVTGANDAPALNANASLPAILEDTLATGAANPGRTVSALFGGAFTDVDNGASLGGIIIVGNAADSLTEGRWQYSTDSGVTWHDVGSVSTSSGLALSAGSKLHFVPVADYHGTPGSLSAHAADNNYAGGYTSGSSHVVFDTTTDAATSGVSDAARTVGTSVSSVNDAPQITSASASATFTEDAAVTALNTVALNGTLTAADVDDASGLVFGIRGATGTTTLSRTGFYGTLSLTGSDWTYTPTNATALNALAAGASVTETFEFSVTDPHGASSTQSLVITLTGTNDAPVLSHAIADQTFNGAGNWTYQLPADAFHDAEGLGLTYTVEVLDGNGDVIDTIGATTGGNASLPSNWLIFNETSHTFSGTPTATAPLPLSLRVIATDPSGNSVSDTFDLALNQPVSDANTVINAAPISTHDTLSIAVGAVQALSIVDFGNYADAEGSALASVKITSLPSNGTFEYSADGSAWSAVTTNQVISRADIDAGHLRITAGTNASLIGFQVSDGTAYSSASYQLAVSPTTASGGVTLADSAVHTAIANTWTSVYSGNPLTGFNTTVRVVIDATGGTIKLSSIPAGVTTNFTGYGNTTDGTATSIAIEGTQADVNTALQLLQANRGSNPGVSLQISAIPGGSAYNPDNGHYYQVVGDGITSYSWSTAKATAAGMSFNGLQGYLATVTSAAENAFILSKVPADAWIGASDAAADGVWKWVTGPEDGTVFSNGNDNPLTVPGQYANWANLEPNGSNGSEDYAEFYASGNGFGAGKWNDLDGSGLNYFIVEYGGTGSDPVVQQASRSITLQAAEPALSIAGSAAYTENAAPTILNPALALTDLDNVALSSATVTLSAGKVAGDTLAFSNTNSTTFGNILATYDANTGALSLSSASSSASLAQWQAALKAVTFSSTSDTPGNGARTVQWQVTDPSGNTSNTGTTSIAVTPVNDAPRASNLSDMTLAAGTDLNLDVSNTFTDPEGQAITYSATLADGSPLPGWLHFNPATHLLTGTPPAGTPSVDVRIVGTDASSAVSATTFTINLADAVLGAAAANNDGTIAISGTANSIGAILTAAAPVDADGRTTTPAVVYQWQVSGDSGSTWSDVSDARGTGSTFTITQAESSKQIRVQSFYTDDGGNAEAPVSNVVTASAFNVSGVVTINGAFTPGQTLVASLSDSNGLLHANPSYQWYRGDTSGFTPGAGNLISGATYNTFTLTNTDGGKYLKVVVTYTDDENGSEVVSDVSGQVQLGAVAPVAVNDIGAITEAGGLLNASGSTAPVTGNIRTNDTDQNNNISSTPIDSLRSGGVEGVGETATDGGTTFSVSGLYGTLTVTKATGAYSYSLNQDHASVEALAPGQTLQDVFNYTVIDNTNLTDNGLVTITINGADDEMIIQGLPSAPLDFSEDLAAELAATFMLVDPDSASAPVALRFVASEGTLAASSGVGVTVIGTETGTLIASASNLANLQNWLAAGGIFYRSAPNDNDGAGSPAASIALSLDSSANLADPGTNVYLPSGTIDINLTAVNDAPIVDLGGSSSAGNDFITTFRPRGSAVAVVDNTVTITDIDSSTITSAVVTLATGADDNVFGTVYETLSSSSGASFVRGGTTLTIAGNGTGTGGLTGATQLNFTGSGSLVDYQEALKTVLYNNSNPNAAAGDRTVTVTLSDGSLASNLASISTAATNGSIAVGQRIFIGGVDSGETVAQVVDTQHFVASGPISGLTSGSALTFFAAGALVTSAVQSGPVIATTTIQVPWTPVIDMNGDSLAGRSHTVTYVEGTAAVAISTADASITDQGGLIRSLTITLTNPLDNGAGVKEYLLAPSVAVSNALAIHNITASGNGTGANGLTGATQIVFTSSDVGGTDATNFQIALRGTKYINEDNAPNGSVARIVTATTQDVEGNAGVGAQTLINLTAVNDAPIGAAHTVTAIEDTTYTLQVGDFPFSDPTDDDASVIGDTNALLAVKITTLPASGTLLLSGVAVTAGQTVSVTDIAAGHLTYAPAANSSGTAATTFTFQVQDNGGTANSGVDLDATPRTLTIDITAANDAPVLTGLATTAATVNEDTTTAQTVADLLGARTDVDTATGSHAASNGILTGMAVYATDETGLGGGHWEYSVNSGTNWATLAPTAGDVVLLRSTDLVRFVPDSLNGTTGHLSYYAWDQATGTAGSTVANIAGTDNLANRGGVSPYSVDAGTVTLTVTDVNDAPTITNGAPAQSVNEEGTLTVTGLSFGDVDISARADGDTANDVLSVTLSVAHGTLALGDSTGLSFLDDSANGDASLTVSGTLDALNAAIGTLSYTPTLDFSGSDSLAVAVNDLGNVGSGGAQNATTAIALTVNPTNDAPVLTGLATTAATVNENTTTAQTVADLLGARTDVDTATGSHSANNGILTGMAVYATDETGVGGGYWEYSINSGTNWATLDPTDGDVVLLRSTDQVRFVPDSHNGTTGHLSYYAWDQATGTPGNTVTGIAGDANLASRGGVSPYSVDAGTVTLTVTDVNDAAVADLNGGTAGIDGSAQFKPRGNPAQVFGSVSISDVDSGDQITGATISLATDTALDNLFDTTYETLYSSSGASFTSGGATLSISGNGTGAHGLTNATVLSITGTASAAIYQAALQTVLYDNTNPNAYAGVRQVTLTVHDDASTTDGTGAADSAVATVNLAVNWSPVVDLNGDAISDSNTDGVADRNNVVSFLENGAGVAIAASDASIIDQDGNLKSVTVTLTNPVNGSAESLFVDASVPYLSSLGITAVVSLDGHTVTFTGNRDGTTFQYALRAVKYINTSDDPTSTTREITVESVDQADHTGLAATAYINPVIINDAPTSADATLTVNEDTTYTFLVSDFPFSDGDANSLLSVRVSSLPTFGTLELDGVAVTAGDLPLDVSLADITDGLFTYVPNLNANDILNGNPDSFSFRVVDDGGSAHGGVPVSVAAYTVTLEVTPVNDLPVPNPPTINITGVAKAGHTLTATLVATDVDFAGGVIPGSEYDVQWQSRSLPSGTWTNIPSATGTSYLLAGTDANQEVRAVVVYRDTIADPITVDSDSPTAPLVIAAADGSLSVDVDGGTDPTHPLTITLPPGTSGPVTINNTGTTPITVTGLVAPTAIITSGDGPLIIDNPTGDVDITNTGTGTVTVDSPDDGSTIAVDGSGPVTVTNPAGDLTVDNTGTGTTTVTGLGGTSTLTTTGSGPTTVTAPADGANVINSGAGDVTVTDPAGDLTVSNAGSGTTTVTGAADDSTITTHGDVTLANPAGDLTLAGDGTNIVTGPVDGATLTNNGTGTTTVTGVDGTLNVAGSGATDVSAPADGSTVVNNGSGDVTVTDPAGDLTVSNAGSGTTTVNGAADGSTITTHGDVTLANPDGDITLAGDGTNTVTSPVDGATLTNNGTGTTTVNGVTGTLNTAGTGSTDINAPADGAVINDTGSGPLSVTDPVGNLTVNNGGGGTATVSGAATGSTITTSGPVTLANPDGDLTLAGTGTNTVTHPIDGATITNNGTGTTTVTGATGTLNTAGTGTTAINGPADGAVINDTGSGPLSVTDPVGDLTVNNGGGGTATVTGAADGSIISTSGNVTLASPDGDLTLAGTGTNTVTGLTGLLTTTGSGPTTVTAPADGATVSNSGSGALSVVDPGSLTIDNDGSTPISVSSPADDAVLTLTGAGPTTISAPDGDLVINNIGTGLANIGGLANGSALTLQGSGPVAISSNLAAGESITLDTSANGNVTLSNTGAGEIHVHGDLALDAADPMTVVLQGDHTTAVTLAGEVALDNTPLNLSLAAGYNPALSDSITLIDNDGSDPVIGTFAGLAEGATLLVGGETFRITYRGGDGGNNVMLTRVNANPGGTVTISGTPIQNATLTASHTLVDADGLGTVTYKWLDGSNNQLGTGNSYTLKPTDVDHNIRAEASYIDGEGTTQTVASTPTSPIINVNDAPTGTVTIGGTAEQGQTLSVTNTLADLDGMGTLSYQWLADGQAIAGATGNTFLLGSAQVGKLVTVSAGYTDAHGTAESVTSGATGIVNTVSTVGESTAPAGTTGTTGDGNGDGIADANQVAVVSTPVSVAGAANAGYVTLVADSNQGQVSSGSTTVVTDFVQSTAPDTMPLNGSAPLGSIGFTAETGTVSGLETFSLYVDPALGVNGYWVQASNGNLVNLASEAYGGTMVVEGDKLRLDFQVQDGSIFDQDGSADGSVQLEGAIGYVPMGLISYTPDAPAPDAHTPVWD